MISVVKESPVYQRPTKIHKDTGSDKVTFEAILQEADTKNQNKRVYPKTVLTDALFKVKDKIKRRSFLGELDHPISSDQVRQTTVMYKEASHLIRETWWAGNLLHGLIETTPYTNNGHILGGLILDKVTVGFSLRGLADVQDNDSYQQVMSPLIMICYDAVSEPSNHRATIQEVRSENLVRIISESKNMVCTSDGKCYLPNLFDELVERHIVKLKKQYL